MIELLINSENLALKMSILFIEIKFKTTAVDKTHILYHADIRYNMGSDLIIVAGSWKILWYSSRVS